MRSIHTPSSGAPVLQQKGPIPPNMADSREEYSVLLIGIQIATQAQSLSREGREGVYATHPPDGIHRVAAPRGRDVRVSMGLYGHGNVVSGIKTGNFLLTRLYPCVTSKRFVASGCSGTGGQPYAGGLVAGSMDSFTGEC